jgi:hypothetical protein
LKVKVLTSCKGLGANVEVFGLIGGLLQFNNSITTNIAGLEEVVGPLSECSEDVRVLLLNGSSLSVESVWLVGIDGLSEWVGLVGGEKGVWALVEDVDVELSLVFVDYYVGSVDSDDVLINRTATQSEHIFCTPICKVLKGVEEDSVEIVVELGGNILGEELNLVDVVTILGSVCGGWLSAILVPHLDSIRNISWFNSSDVEGGSEGVGAVIWWMKQIVQGGGLKTLILSINFGQDEWSGAEVSSQGFSLSLGLVVDSSQGGTDLGGGDESHDVGVVLEHEDFLGRGHSRRLCLH